MEKQIIEIINYMEYLFPNAGCELNYSTDYGFVISVMLSAQTTDKAVNEVTKQLFNDFPTLESLATSQPCQIEPYIKRLGLSDIKSKNIVGIAQGILNNFYGHVPNNKEDLMKLPGVGNKTANVVLAELFNIPQFAVDTHVTRVAKRLGFVSESDNVSIIENKLKNIFEEKDYIHLHHLFIHFGRYFCKASYPKCEECQIKQYCHK